MKNNNHFAFILFILIINYSIGIGNCKHKFIYGKPEDNGFSSQKLDSMATYLKKAGSSSMLLMVDGRIIFEWGETDKRHLIHSLRKPLLNALYGIEVAKGTIDTNMTLRELNIDDIKPFLSENEKDARIIDLLKSRSGVYHDAAAVSEGMRHAKPKRDMYRPGEYYYYNNWDFNTLGAILEQKTKKNIYEMFKEYIAIPIGMHNYTGTFTSVDGESDNDYIPDTDGAYQYEKSKSQYPAYHFRLSTRDLALFGQLYLQMGNWNGKQIIPKNWIELSIKPYSVYNTGDGFAYGMLWSALLKNKYRPGGSFFHTGAGVHMLGVYPNLKLVLVHRVDTEKDYSFSPSDLRKIIDIVFGEALKRNK
jgi:CubicO group peptidase (beta-lactamase class C family)